MSDPYALDDAAAAALWRLRSEPIEHMSGIYQKGNGFGVSNSVQAGSTGHVKGKISVPTGSLRALIHNHPSSGVEAAKFSRDDKNQALRLGVPSYITTPDGRVMRFRPQAGNDVQEVLAQFPLEEIRKRYLVQGLLK